jgi:hypothetical protein
MTATVPSSTRALALASLRIAHLSRRIGRADRVQSTETDDGPGVFISDHDYIPVDTADLWRRGSARYR